MCIYIYIYRCFVVNVLLYFLGACCHMAVSTLFVTTASTETLSGSTLGVTTAPFLPERKLYPKSYRLAKQTSLYTFITRTK